MAERLIFHCDCNNFFASCECLERPELKTVPMAVAGDPENRVGVVVAKNEIAKKYGTGSLRRRTYPVADQQSSSRRRLHQDPGRPGSRKEGTGQGT